MWLSILGNCVFFVCGALAMRLLLLERHAGENVQSVRTTSKVPRHNLICFRITGVPQGWTEEDIIQLFKKLDSSFHQWDADRDRLSLYPSCHGSGQVALLNTAASFELLRQIGTEDTKAVPIPHIVSEKGGALVIVCHFYDLTPLNTPSGEIVADVVAVTGLAGHAFGSWRHHESRQMWLQDFLGKDITNVRVMTYGYNSDLNDELDNSSLLDYRRRFVQQLEIVRGSPKEKKRPIIFLGHSLGGILILQSLVQARNNTSEARLLDSTRAILFFGTPHVGLRTEELEKMVLDISSNPDSSRMKLLKQLRDGSEFLESQKEDLARIWEEKKIRVFSFYETRKTPTAKKDMGKYTRDGKAEEMVKKISGLLFLPGEKRIAMNRNHTEIVKFISEHDVDYVAVLQHIRECLNDLTKEAHEPSEAQKDLLRVLKAPYYSTFRSKVDEPASGTCEWFLHEEKFSHWAWREGSSILWLQGSPGQGKTVLSKFLLEWLESQISKPDRNQRAMVIYFFCSDQDENLRSVESILRAFIEQLLQGPIACFTEWEDPEKVVASTDTLWEAFKELIVSLQAQTIYCVVDGLDECNRDSSGDSLRTFLERVTKLAQKFPVSGLPRCQSPAIKLLVSSRPIEDISLVLSNQNYFNLQARKEDLKKFINMKVSTLPEKFGVELRRKATEKLLGRAERTFLWVSIVLKKMERLRLPTERTLDSLIQESPNDLRALYDGILKKIEDDGEKKLIVWVAYSRRPLTLKELSAAVSTQIDSQSKKATEYDHINLTKRTLTSFFGVILEMTNGEVHLIHQSAKEYILERGTFTAPFFQQAFGPSIYIAKVCMTYLNFEDFRTHSCKTQQELAERKNHYPLLDYAAHHWHAHIQHIDDVQNIIEVLPQLLQPMSPTLISWCQAADIDTRAPGSIRNALEVAKRANIIWLAEYLLGPTNTSIDIDVSADTLVQATVDASQSLLEIVLKATEGVKEGDRVIGAVLKNKRVGAQIFRNCLPDFQVTEEMVLVAHENWVTGDEFIEVLASRNDVHFTDEAVLAVASFSTEKALRALLRTPARSVIRLLSAAASNKRNGSNMVNAVLEIQVRNLIIGPEFIVSVSKNSFHSRQIMVSLAMNAEVHFQHRALITIFKKFDEEMLEVVLNAKATFDIIESIMEAARLGLRRMVELLLAGKPITIVLTEALVTSVMKNAANGKRLLTILLAQYHNYNITVTQGAITAAVGGKGGTEVLKLLLARDPDITIPEEAITAAAGNSGGDKILKLLLARDPNIAVPEEAITAAAGNSGGDKILKLLLARDPNIAIPEEAITAAAGSSIEVLELLLARDPNIAIPEEAIMAAAMSESWDGSTAIRKLELLVAQEHPHITITAAETDRILWRENGQERIKLLSGDPNITIEDNERTASEVSEDDGWTSSEVSEDD